MPNTYSKQVIEAFKDKLETLKRYEEANLALENKLTQHESSTIIRQINIHAYTNVLSMLDEHFKLSSETPTRKGRGGRPKGSTNKPKEATVSDNQDGKPVFGVLDNE